MEALMNEVELAQAKLEQLRQEHGIPQREPMKRIHDPATDVPLPQAMERFLNRYEIVDEDACLKCGGSGWETIVEGKITSVARCSCQKIEDRRLKLARIPDKYLLCDFLSFDTEGAHFSIANALFFAKNFAHNYPVDKRGIMFHGGVGTGKTHLSCAILLALITKGCSGLFMHYPELLQMIRQSYNDDGVETEASLLRPVYDSEVMLLDELGAVKATEFTVEMLTLILNHRYSADKTTIATTNFAPSELRERIGDRAYSRLSEMCRFVQVDGDDFRRKR
jgi:DNA replication protein DnaC